MRREAFAAMMAVLIGCPARGDDRPTATTVDAAKPVVAVPAPAASPAPRGAMYYAPTMAPLRGAAPAPVATPSVVGLPAPAPLAAPIAPPVAPPAVVAAAPTQGRPAAGPCATGGCATCATNRGDCWDRLADWLCYRRLDGPTDQLRPKPYHPSQIAYFPYHGPELPPPQASCGSGHCNGQVCPQCGQVHQPSAAAVAAKAPTSREQYLALYGAPSAGPAKPGAAQGVKPSAVAANPALPPLIPGYKRVGSGAESASAEPPPAKSVSGYRGVE